MKVHSQDKKTLKLLNNMKPMVTLYSTTIVAIFIIQFMT